MNFYFVEKVSKEDRSSVMAALRNVMQSMYRGFNVKPVMMDASKDQDQIFLEVPDGLLWGRILAEPFSLQSYKMLCDEWDDWVQATGEKLMLYIFFPCVTDGLFDALGIREETLLNLTRREGVRFFEYFFLSPADQEGIALREWSLHELIKKMPSLNRAVRDTSASRNVPYRFFREACLNSQELDEFLDLGVLLKRVS